MYNELKNKLNQRHTVIKQKVELCFSQMLSSSQEEQNEIVENMINFGLFPCYNEYGERADAIRINFDLNFDLDSGVISIPFEINVTHRTDGDYNLLFVTPNIGYIFGAEKYPENLVSGLKKYISNKFEMTSVILYRK